MGGVNLANIRKHWSLNPDTVGFTGRRAQMRWSNSGKVLCEENKIADTVYSNKSQEVHNWGISPAQARLG
jgi:hypothetical protein